MRRTKTRISWKRVCTNKDDQETSENPRGEGRMGRRIDRKSESYVLDSCGNLYWWRVYVAPVPSRGRVCCSSAVMRACMLLRCSHEGVYVAPALSRGHVCCSIAVMGAFMLLRCRHEDVYVAPVQSWVRLRWVSWWCLSCPRLLAGVKVPYPKAGPLMLSFASSRFTRQIRLSLPSTTTTTFSILSDIFFFPPTGCYCFWWYSKPVLSFLPSVYLAHISSSLSSFSSSVFWFHTTSSLYTFNFLQHTFPSINLYIVVLFSSP